VLKYQEHHYHSILEPGAGIDNITNLCHKRKYDVMSKIVHIGKHVLKFQSSAPIHRPWELCGGWNFQMVPVLNKKITYWALFNVERIDSNVI